MNNKTSNILFQIAVPIILGISILYFYLHSRRAANELGLGKGTSFYTAEYKHSPIHITTMDMADSMIRGWKNRGANEVSLWFGNSQLNGINQYQPGQRNCTAIAFDSLQQYRKEVLGVSFPNGNMQEFLLSMLYLNNKLQVKNIVVPVFFDDMREAGIRAEINIKEVSDLVHSGMIDQYCSAVTEILSLKQNETSAGADHDMAALDQTAQESSEKYLDKQLKSYWRIWADRGDIRGNLFNDVYKLRNYVLGIKATSVRKMIPGKYQPNYAAFLNILRFAHDKGIRIFVYIPPIRNDVTQPYDLAAYAAFKASIKEDCIKWGSHFINLENLVPARYWGNKAGTAFGEDEEIDFMHFQQEGHQLIADTIFRTLVKSSD